MRNEKLLTNSKIAPSLKTIKVKSSFGQTLSKILKLKNHDYVVIQRPSANQMLAAVVARLFGRNFFWVQKYHNPPTANFFQLMLLSRADRILIESKGDLTKLTTLGIAKSKIHYQKAP